MAEEKKYGFSDEELLQYLNEDVTAEKKTRVENWLSASEDHQLQLLQIKTVWLDTGKWRPMEAPDLDVESALAKVKERRDQIVEKRSSKTIGDGANWLLRIAAVLILGLTIVLWFLGNSTEPLLLEADNLEVQHTLDDGSVVTLAEGTTLEVQPFKSSRELQLSGTAYFNVTPDKSRPFIVNTSDVSVQVLGTKFSIAQNEKGISVSVEEGRVSVAAYDSELILIQNQTAIFNRSSRTLNLVETPDTGEYRFWKTKQLSFKAMKLIDVIKTLNRVYATEILVPNSNLEDCLLSVSFENESLETILSVISLTLNLEIIKEQDSIILSGEGC